MADTPDPTGTADIGTHSSYADGTPRAMTRGHRTSSASRRSGGIVDWLFRSRATGTLTIAQVPNAPILVWLAATVLQVWWNPQVGGRDVLTIVSIAALVIWASDEVLRGVNPFRRILGAAVLTWVAVGLLS
jgi:hypothetical protein